MRLSVTFGSKQQLRYIHTLPSSYSLSTEHCPCDQSYPCSTLEVTYGCDCGACACGGGGGGDGDCEDSDGAATDPYGDGCAAYYHYPSWCGGYDDADFTSNEMCCVCGGGVEEGAPSSSPTSRPTPFPTYAPSPAPSSSPEPTAPVAAPTPTPQPSVFSCGPSCFGQSCGYWEERG